MIMPTKAAILRHMPIRTFPNHSTRQPLIKLASDPACAAISGRYFLKEKEVRSSPLSYDTEVATRLWETSAALIAAAL